MSDATLEPKRGAAELKLPSLHEAGVNALAEANFTVGSDAIHVATEIHRETIARRKPLFLALKDSIQPATSEDVKGIQEVLLDAQTFQKQRAQNDPSVKVWLGKNFTEEAVGKVVSSGSYHVAKLNGEVVGVMSVTFEDKAYWGDVPDRNAAYVHKVATSNNPDIKGQGLTQALLEHAEKLALQNGCDCVRLDTHPHLGLRKNYTQWGYRLHSTNILPANETRKNPYMYCRYEKPLTEQAQLTFEREMAERLAAKRSGETETSDVKYSVVDVLPLKKEVNRASTLQETEARTTTTTE